ncbi:hypothetical protein CANINC_001238 [Pichia inconspicua]|uniref:Uncharacterized protein n=1 Tax=Pichia inconspicua TaxID=52247 RepID=A0A4T0X471_9ASCO|nr:hypothetical protein CANINC_001238 [[Candida] inconspicua]
MATFFRDSSLFASRNGKPLFGEKKGEQHVEREQSVHDDPTDDDEVEITDVREVADPDNTEEHTMDNSITNDTADTSVDNGDKSLEYLLNTIAHLNERNSKLQGQLTLQEKQNKHLTGELALKTEAVDALKGHLTRVRSTVKSSHALFTELRAQFSANTTSTREAVAELSNTKKNVAKQHEVIASLKNLVSKIKSELTANEIAMHEKNNIINNLKRQSNELAGHLTEQKLANTALQKSITESARLYKDNVVESTTKYTELLNKYSEEKRAHVEEWDRVVALVSSKLGESLEWSQSAISAVRENLNDNFNDIALRLTALTSTADAVATQISGGKERVELVQTEIVSALSDVDKNLSIKLADVSEALIKKFNGLSSVEDLQREIETVLTTVNRVDEKAREIIALREKSSDLEKIISKLEINVVNLTKEVNIKDKALQDVQNKLEKVHLESSTLESEKNTTIQLLQENSIILTKEMEKLKLQSTLEKEDHKSHINMLEEKARKVETQNIKLFNEEKNKNARLERELKLLNDELNEEKNKLAQQSHSFTSFTEKIQLLEEQLSTYKNDNSSADQITKLEEKINILRDNVAEKQKLVDSLRATLHEKEKSIAKLEEKIAQPPLPPPIFPESRTSTVIKKEPLSQVKTEKPKSIKKPKTKRATPKIKSTTTRASKRKLLDSSQDSTKSQSLQKKRSDSVKKSILEDLDIFNEFVAMDRMESIGKPNW